MLMIDFHVSYPKWKKPVASSAAQFEKALQKTCASLELPKRKFSVAVTFVNDTEIQSLNAQYRHKDKPTNVLSFPMIDDFSNFDHYPKQTPIELGDIILAYETIANEAALEDKTLADHTTHLLVHGLLHLFGYDHMTKKEEKEMEQLEVAILSSLGISNPYL